jgi:hypothetical protein
MIIKGIKDSIKTVRVTGITLNIGFIGLSFAGGSSKVNIAKDHSARLMQRASFSV